MAGLSNDLVWEVRPGVGSDTACGGGFVTGSGGTDWSQQDAAQYSLTGLTTSGASAVILTASASSDMLGNLIQITGGTNFIPGFYQITAVVAGVSITVNTACTSGSGLAGTGFIGGALATIATVIANGITDGNLVYVKATGSYTVTTPQIITLAETSGNGPVSFIGYTTTRGDNGRVTWTTATNSTDLLHFQDAKGVSFYNFAFTNTAGTGAFGAYANTTNYSGNILFDNCSWVAGFTRAIMGDASVEWGFNTLVLSNCEVANCSDSTAAVINSGQFNAYDTYFHDNTGVGFKMGGNGGDFGQSVFTRCTFYNNLGGTVDPGTSDPSGSVQYYYFIFHSCNFVSNSGDGIAATVSANRAIITTNCIFYGNGGFAVNFGSNVPGMCSSKNCAFGSNTSGNRSVAWLGVSAQGDIALTADPFVGRTSGNFALNTTAGGGALLRALGFPGVTSSFGTGFIDVGALQHQDSGGGSSGMLYIPNLEGT